MKRVKRAAEDLEADRYITRQDKKAFIDAARNEQLPPKSAAAPKR